MSLTLYAHPFSSYCQKVLIALWENGTPFEYRLLGPQNAPAMDELKARWPFGKFPVLVDGGRTVAESSIIIEHLSLHHAGPTLLLPADPEAALEVRFMDRVFDNHVMTAMQGPVIETLRTEDEHRRAQAIARARTELDTAYGWLDERLGGREWAVGDSFTMADCAAAPALFYSDWVHQIGEQFPNLRAYRTRLNARPSFARAIEEARPYRDYFPLGAPDRD